MSSPIGPRKQRRPLVARACVFVVPSGWVPASTLVVCRRARAGGEVCQACRPGVEAMPEQSVGPSASHRLCSCQCAPRRQSVVRPTIFVCFCRWNVGYTSTWNSDVPVSCERKKEQRRGRIAARYTFVGICFGRNAVHSVLMVLGSTARFVFVLRVTLAAPAAAAVPAGSIPGAATDARPGDVPNCRRRRRLDAAEIGDQALTGRTSLL